MTKAKSQKEPITTNTNATPKHCPYLACPTDSPTKVAHMGWRFVYTIVAWFVLQYGVIAGSGFNVSLTLFTIPLLMDYLRFTPADKGRKVLRIVGIATSASWAAIGFLGLIGIFSISNINGALSLISSKTNLVLQGSYICSLASLWWSIFFSVLITFLDWMVYDPPLGGFLNTQQEGESA